MILRAFVVCLPLVACYGPAPLPPAFSDCDASQGDPWDLVTDGAEDPIAVVAGELRVRVGYGGGCAEHEFQICWDGGFLESNPVQARLDLLHRGNNDGCDAYLTEELSFDLAPMRSAWQESYGGGAGTMILRLGDASATYAFDG